MDPTGFERSRTDDGLKALITPVGPDPVRGEKVVVDVDPVSVLRDDAGVVWGLEADARTSAQPDLGGLLSSTCSGCGGACGGHSVDAFGALVRMSSVTVSSTAGSATPDQFATYLTTRSWTEKGEVPHSWDTATNNVITVSLTGLTAEMQVLVRAALESWETVADIDFREVSGGADVKFSRTGSGAVTSALYEMDGDMVSSTVTVSDTWFAANGSSLGSYSMQTYVHEIGHALGLGHAGGYGVRGGTIYANDSWQMSVMSYTSQAESTTVNASKAVVLTPMMADIIAVQSMYGKPVGGPTAGNTTYGKGATLDTYLDDVFAGQGASMANNAITIFDEGGYDKIDFSSDTRSQRVDLNGQTYSDVYGKVGNLAIAKGTVIEEYVAGSMNDTVTGNAVANSLRAMNGNDTVYGRDGNDFIDGGAGNDVLFGGNGLDRLLAWSGNDKLYGELGNDTLEGGDGNDFQRGDGGNDLLKGGNGNDSLYGSDGVDQLYGDAGNDVLGGDAGNDFLSGGAGNDAMTGASGGDVFVFTGGRDTVRDFQDNADTLRIDDNLFGGRKLTVQQVLDTYARVVDGYVLFDFGGGTTFAVQGVRSVSLLSNDLEII